MLPSARKALFYFEKKCSVRFFLNFKFLNFSILHYLFSRLLKCQENTDKKGLA